VERITTRRRAIQLKPSSNFTRQYGNLKDPTHLLIGQTQCTGNCFLDALGKRIPRRITDKGVPGIVRQHLWLAWTTLLKNRSRNVELSTQVSVARLNKGKTAGRDVYKAEYMARKDSTPFRPFRPRQVDVGRPDPDGHIFYQELLKGEGQISSPLTAASSVSPATPADNVRAASIAVVNSGAMSYDGEDNTLPSSYTPTPAGKGKGRAASKLSLRMLHIFILIKVVHSPF